MKARPRLLVLLVLSALCSLATAVAEPTLMYTGKLYNRYGSTILCAEAGVQTDSAVQPLTDAAIFFSVTDLWDVTRIGGASGSVETNALGQAALLARITPGVYEVQTFGKEGGPLAGVESSPAAITIADPCRSGWLVESGRLWLKNQDGVTGRYATFGLYYDWSKPTPRSHMQDLLANGQMFYLYLDEGKSEQFLFLDPENPGGPVRIRIRDFKNAYIRYKSTVPYTIIDTRFVGYCEYSIGDSAPLAKVCEVVFPASGMESIVIDVLDYRWKSVYHAAGPIRDGVSELLL